jgi:uncharacterized protein YkwD
MPGIFGPSRRAVRVRAVLACLLAFAVCGSALGGAAAAPRPSGGVTAPLAVTAAQYSPDSEECAFLTLINNFRASKGRPALTLIATLGAAAEHHSIDMATNNYFSHTLSDGTTWSQNITDHGYTHATRAENIAAGNAGAQATFNQWKKSKTHKKNMLSAKFAAIGIGRAFNASSQYDWYWTTTFGGAVQGAALC